MNILILLLLITFPTNLFSKWNITSEIDKDRRYNEVTWLTAHNADMSYPNGWMIVNQTKGLNDLMENYGVRALMLDIFRSSEGPIGKKKDKEEIVSCHQKCDITANVLRPMKFPALLEEDLKVVKEFLDGHQNEIITILFEDYVPGDYRSELSALMEKVGLKNYLLTPNDVEMFDKNPVVKWPTLNELIAKGKRLIAFSPRGNPFISQWSFMVENHYNYGEEKGEKCEKRGESKDGLVGQSFTLFNVNHFYDFALDIHLVHDPRVRFINHGYFNGPLLEKYINDVCIPKWKRIPNFISVDHANRHSSVYGGIEMGEFIKKLNKMPAWKYYADEDVRTKLFPNWKAEEEKENADKGEHK